MYILYLYYFKLLKNWVRKSTAFFYKNNTLENILKNIVDFRLGTTNYRVVITLRRFSEKQHFIEEWKIKR